MIFLHFALLDVQLTKIRVRSIVGATDGIVQGETGAAIHASPVKCKSQRPTLLATLTHSDVQLAFDLVCHVI